jgi:hypothetical protein
VEAKERPKDAHPSSHQYLKQLHLYMFNKFRMKKSQNMPIWLIKMVLTQHYYTGYWGWQRYNKAYTCYWMAKWLDWSKWFVISIYSFAVPVSILVTQYLVCDPAH